jgi:glycosyltransferase involved in cell wall biosynthesis
LAELASRLGLKVYFRGFLSGEALARAFTRADIFIHPASYEGWGVVLNHATYFGLPVIAFEGVRSARGLLVKHGVNGFVFSNEKEFAEALERLAVDGNLRKAFSQASRQIGSHWTVEALGSKLAAVFNNPDLTFTPGEPLGVVV